MMRVFTSTTFDGFWPVGSAAVVVASNAEEAKEYLLKALEAHGLPQRDPSGVTVRELPVDRVFARILCDGNY